MSRPKDLAMVEHSQGVLVARRESARGLGPIWEGVQRQQAHSKKDQGDVVRRLGLPVVRWGRRARRSLLVTALLGSLSLVIAACAGLYGQNQDDSSPWSILCPYGRPEFISLAFSTESDGWAVVRPALGGGRELQWTDDGGRSWQLCVGTITGGPAAEGGLPAASIDRLCWPGQVLCVGRRMLLTYRPSSSAQATEAQQASGVLASSDAGATWRQILSVPAGDAVLALAAADAAHLWAVCGTGDRETGSGQYLLASRDGGATWERLPRGSYGAPWSYPSHLRVPPLIFVDARAGWSLYRPSPDSDHPSGSIDTTADGGRTWKAAQEPESGLEHGLFWGFSALSAEQAWVVFREPGERSPLMWTVDGGSTWKRCYVDDRALLGVGFVDSDHGWVVGNIGRRNAIYATDDGGEHWQREITLQSNDSNTGDDWVFIRAGDSLYASNGDVLLSREMPPSAD